MSIRVALPSPGHCLKRQLVLLNCSPQHRAHQLQCGGELAAYRPGVVAGGEGAEILLFADVSEAGHQTVAVFVNIEFRAIVLQANNVLLKL